jgi:S1-C subfamily serine protease/pSer/pThr/pTyr-binding forkhead associated (FHA) protein
MSVELRVLSGARAGQRERFDKSVIAIGRHPMSDLRFDPEADRDVSARHAEIRVVGGRVALHDTNSTNGTFVNGRRIAAETELQPGDVLSFGEHGPKVEFRFAVAADAAGARGAAVASAAEGGVATARRTSGASRLAPPQGRGAGGSRPAAPAAARRTTERTTGERIALAVREHTRPLKFMLLGLGILSVAGIGIAYWVGHREAAERGAELDALLARNATLSQAYSAELSRMAGTVTGLDSALTLAKRETDVLRQRMQRERDGNARNADVAEWGRRLARAEERHVRLASAASMDAAAVAAQNGGAVALVAVEMPDGKAYSGTGFNIRRDGMIVTNRHLLHDDRGQPARRIMVIFSDTRQWLPARIAKSSGADDLAFLRIDIPGSYPIVAGIGDGSGPAVGEPVVLIGYPLGTATAGMAGDVSRITARSTLGVGTVSKRLGDVLQIDAYAGEGSSGSPVFDARGRVAGVVYGGATESAGRIVYAVPAEKLLRELPE